MDQFSGGLTEPMGGPTSTSANYADFNLRVGSEANLSVWTELRPIAYYNWL